LLTLFFKHLLSLVTLCTSIPGASESVPFTKKVSKSQEIKLQNCGNITSNAPRTLNALWVAQVFPLLWYNTVKGEDEKEAATYYKKEGIQMGEGGYFDAFIFMLLLTFFNAVMVLLPVKGQNQTAW